MARGFVFPEAFMQDRAIGKDEAPHMKSLAAMLRQAVSTPSSSTGLAGRYELQQTGRMNEIRQVPFSIGSPDDAGTFMGFSRARLHRNLVRRVNAELERMKAEGVVGEIEQKYLP